MASEPNTQVVQIPLTGGLAEKQEIDWLDPAAGAYSIVNGQFTKLGSVAHRLGLQFLSTTGVLGSTASPVSWSRHPIAEVVSNSVQSALQCYDPNEARLGLSFLVPRPLTRRRALPNAYTPAVSGSVSSTPVIVDAAPLNLRCAFFAQDGATWCQRYDLTTSEPVGRTFRVSSLPAAVITGFYVSDVVQGISLLLQFVSGAVYGIQISGLAGPAPLANKTMTLAGIACMDAAPLQGDPNGTIVALAQVASTGVWTWTQYGSAWNVLQYGSLATTPSSPPLSTCSVAGVYGTAGTGTIAFLFCYLNAGGALNSSLAICSGDGAFTFTAPWFSAATIVSENVTVYAGGVYVFRNNLFGTPGYTIGGGVWTLAGPVVGGILAPQWLPFSFVLGSSMPTFADNSAPTSYLGMWPVGRPFVPPGAYQAYQPVVCQLGTLLATATPGSVNVQSEQCTLYLLNLTTGAIESTVAPRQVDPAFSYWWLSYPSGSYPCSSYLSNRFAVGVDTLGEDVPGTGSAQSGSWATDWYFDAASIARQYGYAEIAGDLRLACSVPTVCDGVACFEDSFFYYPEFATVSVPASGGVTWTNGNKLLSYAVVYVSQDGSGQLQRSAPVYTPMAVSVNGDTQDFSVAVCAGDGAGGTFTCASASVSVTFSVAQFMPAGTIITAGGVNFTLAYAVYGATSGTLTGVAGHTLNAVPFTCVCACPVVNFPPYQASGKVVNAEIYRTENLASYGAIFYLEQSVSAQWQSPPGSWPVGSVSVSAGGTYSSVGGLAVSLTGGGGSGAAAAAVISGGNLTGITITAVGGGYMQSVEGAQFPVTITGVGSGAQATATVGQFGVISQVVITNAGQGYTSATTIAFDQGDIGGTGRGATATATVSSLFVGALTLTQAGSGYTSAPAVAITGGTYTWQAQGSAALNTAPASAIANITYTDGASDTSIAQSTILYTTGGVLDGVNPPAALCQCVHWNRLWIVDETGTTIWFTKQLTEGESPAFNEALTIYFPDGGDITALASMDDKLVIFKAGGISVVYGQGPADNGQGSDLTQPQSVASDTGCIDWRSVVLTPIGLFFQSPTGLYLLDRSLQVSWIGQSVVDTLFLYPTVQSTALIPTATQVRFVCSSPSTGASIVIVYDYLAKQWTTFRYDHTSAPISGMAFAETTTTNSAGALVPTAFTVATTSDGTLWREQDPALATLAQPVWEDTDTIGNYYFVPPVYKTAWFKLQGVQGLQRARRVQVMAETQDAAGLTVGLAVNYDPATVQSHTWTDYTLSNLDVPQVSMMPAGAYNTQQALQVTVQDVGGPLATSGKGLRLVSIAVELQRLGDHNPLVPARGRA